MTSLFPEVKNNSSSIQHFGYILSSIKGHHLSESTLSSLNDLSDSIVLIKLKIYFLFLSTCRCIWYNSGSTYSCYIHACHVLHHSDNPGCMLLLSQTIEEDQQKSPSTWSCSNYWLCCTGSECIHGTSWSTTRGNDAGSGCTTGK